MPAGSRAGAFGPKRLTLAVLTFFSAIGLALATLGLYAVISYGVAQRTQEFGIRLAIGAPRSAIVALVVREGTRLACAGIALGVAAAAVATRLMASQLYGVAPPIRSCSRRWRRCWRWCRSARDTRGSARRPAT